MTYSKLTQVGNQYSFAIIADPQLIDDQDYYDDWERNPNLNYRMYYGAIKKINTLQPAFAVIIGDLVNKPDLAPQYRNFVRLTKLLQVPTLLVYGNHDGAAPFTQFFNAQQEISGLQALYYSFDAGKWHYIILPVIESGDNPEPMLNWLAEDLRTHQNQPTMVFIHYPYMPQGLTQLEYYAQNPIELRRRILDEILRYGNVKYWFAGHTHNGIQTSVKIAWEYRGCKFITVPSITLSRNFGEEYPAFDAGLTKGGYFMTVEVNGDSVALVGRRAGQSESFTYPGNFQPFHPQIDPRWLERVPNFAPQPFTNGNFENGLSGWNKVWRYQADQEPGFVISRTERTTTAGNYALVLLVREKGQNWSFDELAEIYQVVGVPANTFPLIRLNYYIAQLSAIGGGYLRIHAYRNSSHQFTMVLYFGHDGNHQDVQHTGKIFYLTATGEAGGLAQFKQLINQKKVMFWQLNQQEDRWHQLQVDLKKLYRSASQLTGEAKPFEVDKIFLGLGVWNGKIPGSTTKVFFDQVRLTWEPAASTSENDGQNLPVNRDIYRERFVGVL